MRPDFYGLSIAPSIPKEWESLEIEKDFRGKHLHILVKNPEHAETGCKKLTLNGEELKGSYLPESKMKEQNEIILEMS